MPFVRQGETRKVAVIYRGSEPMPSQAHTIVAGAEDDSTDKNHERVGIEILAKGRQFVAYGICPTARVRTAGRCAVGPKGRAPITSVAVRALDLWGKILRW